MALLNTSFLMIDPDFADTLVLIRRPYTTSQFARTVIVEDPPQNIIAVVQSDTSEADESMEREKQSSKFADGIIVHYKGVLHAEGPNVGTTGFYADILIWNNKRYQVKRIEENFSNYGAGFTKAFCLTEAADGEQ